MSNFGPFHHKSPGPIDIDPFYYSAQICDITFNEEGFFVSILSGRRGRTYVLAPKHAKRLLMLLERELKAYEGKYGPLKTALPKKPTLTAEEKAALGFSH